ncbi:MAG: FHA domain-containing protein [Acidimicrobiia bacterium]|nr:FHA domain-containing protein [Acidimicrobiia bacterium]
MTVAVRAGPVAGTHRLPPGRHAVGRHPAAALHLPDPAVDAHQATIEVDPTGDVRVTDTGSTNGTRLGDGWLDARPRRVGTGEPLSLGATVLRLESAVPAPRARTTATADGGSELHRPPRSTPPPAPEPVALPRPPEPVRPIELGLVTLVAPVVLGVVLGAVSPPGPPVARQPRHGVRELVREPTPTTADRAAGGAPLRGRARHAGRGPRHGTRPGGPPATRPRPRPG